MNISLTIQQSGDEFAAWYAALENREGLHRAMAHEACGAVQDYVRTVAAAKHPTARKLGATPTGALEKAAADRITWEATGEVADVVLLGKIFTRAFGDVTIRPTTAKALTIPIHAISYGATVAELERQGYKFFKNPKAEGKKERAILWATDPRGSLLPLYVLATEAFQPQDRELLPPDEDLLAVAEDAAGDFMEQIEA